MSQIPQTTELACPRTPFWRAGPISRGNGRVTNHKDAEMALRWTAACFIEAENSFKKLRDNGDLKILINSLRPAVQPLKKAA